MFSHNIFSTLKDGNNSDKLSFKMTTTENNKNGKDAESMLEEGMRKRAGKHQSALSAGSKQLSVTSMMYDVDGDGKLDDAEKAMREMDTDNRGYLTNEKVYKVMLEQMKLQQEVFGLKRMSLVFLVVVFLLSLGTLASSFAAATLAKDTNVSNGNLVAKDGGGVVGTSSVATTFIVTEGAPSPDEGGTGRRIQNTPSTFNGGREIGLASSDAGEVWNKCRQSNSVFLQRSCRGGTVIVDVPICAQGSTTLTSDSSGPIYTYTKTSDSTQFTEIDCSTYSSTSPCKVTFPTGAQGCPVVAESTVNLGTAGNYAILTKTGITNVPASVITGNIGVSPIAATAMTGFSLTLDKGGQFSTSTQITSGDGDLVGQCHAASYGGDIAKALSSAVSDMEAAYTDVAGRTNDNAVLNLGAGHLGGVYGGAGNELTPGLYTFGSDVIIESDITFKGTGGDTDVFIIQMTGNLLQFANTKVILEGGALANNIFWQVDNKVDVLKGAHMEGIILVKTYAAFVTGSSLNGRVLAQTACTLQMTTINSL
jgi:hypothetical protein